MALWIALFRGINVGGNHLLPMAELRSLLEGMGCDDVRTYIQSGNVVLRSSVRSRTKLQDAIGQAVEDAKGFRAPVLVLSAKELDSAVRKNPFGAVEDGKLLHFNFLYEKPKRPDLAGLEQLATQGEELRLIERVLYVHTPQGLARSKVALQIEKRLGVQTGEAT